MNRQPKHHASGPSRRRVLLAGAGAGAAALLGTGLPAAAAAATAPAAGGTLQPYASYFFPDSLPAGTPAPGVVWRSLKSWTPQADPDLAWNASTVPLASRFAPVPPNTTARAGQARVSALAAFATTSANPSQGAPTADYYALTQWAYLDELVFWGGSSGEGLILAPNAPVVDAAHRNGVPVLGNVFLPPVAYGGDLRWTRDLVQRDTSGAFPVADRMIALAGAYGFDGWFVNAETDGGDTQLATDIRDFIVYLRAHGQGLRITWYDAMTATGAVDWRNELDASNEEFFRASDAMFLNFAWSRSGLASSAALAASAGRSRYDLQAGIDVESGGWNTGVDWDAIVPTSGAQVMSYGFYRPEWTFTSLPAGHAAPADFHVRDDQFWSGSALDPTAPASGGAGWRAPAASVADRSTIASAPFATSFNTGHGLRWYENGTPVSDTAWNHLGLQDRLPGRRWVVRTKAERPQVGLDFADAWRGGSSLLVSGPLGAPTTVELYGTRLPLTAGTVVDIAHRTDTGSAAVTVELAVAFSEPAAPGTPYHFSYLPAGTLPAGGHGWTTATVRIPAGLGSMVHALGVRLTAKSGTARWRLGSLAVHDTPETPGPPSGLTVTASQRNADGTAQLRLSWDRSPGAVRHYELHQVLPGGGRRFLGGTCGAAGYVGALHREAAQPATRLELRAVDELFTASAPAVTDFPW